MLMLSLLKKKKRNEHVIVVDDDDDDDDDDGDGGFHSPKPGKAGEALGCPELLNLWTPERQGANKPKP